MYILFQFKKFEIFLWKKRRFRVFEFIFYANNFNVQLQNLIKLSRNTGVTTLIYLHM